MAELEKENARMSKKWESMEPGTPGRVLVALANKVADICGTGGLSSPPTKHIEEFVDGLKTKLSSALAQLEEQKRETELLKEKGKAQSHLIEIQGEVYKYDCKITSIEDALEIKKKEQQNETLKLERNAMLDAAVDKKDELAQLRADLARFEGDAKREWEPIESAPKDGTHILCYSPDRISEAWYRPDMLDLTKTVLGGIGWCYAGLKQPTHWMPLPAPPAAMSAKGETP